MSADPVVDEHLARRLVDAQFPRWAGLPLRPVTAQGWDNRTVRLGDALTVRLPSAAWYAAQVEKEQRWLPVLAPQLPLPVPTPVAQGFPGSTTRTRGRCCGGSPANRRRRRASATAPGFAADLAAFLVALRAADATGGPAPGPHNFHRGGALSVYAEETLRAVDTLGTAMPRDTVLAVWDDAVASRWDRDRAWVHRGRGGR